MVLILFTTVFAYFLYPYIKDKKRVIIDNFNFKLDSKIYFWIALFLTQVGFGGFYNFFTIYELDSGLKLDTITYLWVFGVLAEIVMFYFQNRVLNFNLLFLIKISILFTAIRWLLIELFNDNVAILFVSQLIHAFSLALLHTASITYINKVYENKYLSQQFYTGVTFGIGMFIGSIFSGIFYQNHLFLYSSLITFVGFIFIFKVKNDIIRRNYY
jgi:PPP family 3-phenylpropionic acid transporter